MARRSSVGGWFRREDIGERFAEVTGVLGVKNMGGWNMLCMRDMRINKDFVTLQAIAVGGKSGGFFSLPEFGPRVS